MKVVERYEPEPKNLLGFDQMTDVSAREIAAAVATAIFFDWSGVFGESGIFERERAMPRERGSITRNPCGQDAVEHVHSARDHFDHLGRRSEPHRIPRAAERKKRLGAFDSPHHLGLRLPHAHAANGVAVEFHLHERTGAAFAQV